jgi:hypothetical protein
MQGSMASFTELVQMCYSYHGGGHEWYLSGQEWTKWCHKLVVLVLKFAWIISVSGNLHESFFERLNLYESFFWKIKFAWIISGSSIHLEMNHQCTCGCSSCFASPFFLESSLGVFSPALEWISTVQNAKKRVRIHNIIHVEIQSDATTKQKHWWT